RSCATPVTAERSNTSAGIFITVIVGCSPRRMQPSAHELISGIDENCVASDASAEIAGQENRGIGNFRRLAITAERSSGGHCVHHFGEIPYAARRRRFHRARGDRVDANAARSE